MLVARPGMNARARTLAVAATCALIVLPACDGEPDIGVREDAAVDATAPSLNDGGIAVPAERDDLCYDEADNDSNGAVDCEEPTCHVEVACCVGSARSECCDPTGTTSTLSLAGCVADGPADGCVTADPAPAFFGAASPVIEDGALVPQGGAGHGGVVLREVDPRATNVVLDATIEVPVARCGTDCVDGAGIALLDAVPVAGAPAVARFGILVSGSRDEVVVLLADEPIARAPITNGSSTYRIEIDITGSAVAFAGEAELARVSDLDLPSRGVLAVFGRTQNRGPDEEAVRVRSASATTRSCDAPAALARGVAPVLPWSGATWDPRQVRRPSVVTYDASGVRRALMAYGYEGQIHLAGRTGFGEFRSATSDPGPPALVLPAELASARDPWLLVHQARFVLFFTGVDAAGRTSIWKSTGDADYAQSFSAPVRVLSPLDFGFDAIDGGAILVDGFEGSWTMVARARTGEEHRIVRFDSSDEGLSWATTGVTLREPRTNDLFAFDRDEVAAPALVRYPDAQGRLIDRLYYAGRRGTAWRIGLLVSSGADRWRAVGPVLEPAAGFDALGVTDPAPVVEDGVLRLYYAGSDGTRFRIGVSGPAGTVGE
jgi:hypothetical protein